MFRSRDCGVSDTIFGTLLQVVTPQEVTIRFVYLQANLVYDKKCLKVSVKNAGAHPHPHTATVCNFVNICKLPPVSPKTIRRILCPLTYPETTIPNYPSRGSLTVNRHRRKPRVHVKCSSDRVQFSITSPDARVYASMT